MTPDQIAKSGTEHAHQCALFAAIALAHPLTGPSHPLHWLYAIHNKGHGDAVRGAHARAEGVKAGVPDTFLPIPIIRRGADASFYENWYGCYVELKVPAHATHKNGNCSPDQIKWIIALRLQGYYVNVCFGWGDAFATFNAYLRGEPLPEFYVE